MTENSENVDWVWIAAHTLLVAGACMITFHLTPLLKENSALRSSDRPIHAAQPPLEGVISSLDRINRQCRDVLSSLEHTLEDLKTDSGTISSSIEESISFKTMAGNHLGELMRLSQHCVSFSDKVRQHLTEYQYGVLDNLQNLHELRQLVDTSAAKKKASIQGGTEIHDKIDRLVQSIQMHHESNLVALRDLKSSRECTLQLVHIVQDCSALTDKLQILAEDIMKKSTRLRSMSLTIFQAIHETREGSEKLFASVDQLLKEKIPA